MTTRWKGGARWGFGWIARLRTIAASRIYPLTLFLDCMPLRRPRPDMVDKSVSRYEQSVVRTPPAHPHASSQGISIVSGLCECCTRPKDQGNRLEQAPQKVLPEKEPALATSGRASMSLACGFH
ncbi:hypothetical protein BDY17DRAFT_53645 [Neohortaea acidophila]|uniref:Uncharacterized protein n=1 Tax=Neohortaea acidophila TaxID=245834 RepID=A0A6A6PHS1_9PEZI|nr:uncharacterized protein BDY17DRAFT_53645 [Neohortaea acidophila]KAF2479281.1 hypothetical protein BDY17DRAFT_53645 [Neohortaea acidophila]